MESTKLTDARPEPRSQLGVSTLEDDGDTQVRFIDDRRSTAVWRQWLSSMASDAEAALAAAIAYRDLDARGRESWLDSLADDAPEVDVPAIALYAPLLAVENDPERRLRLLSALGPAAEIASPRGQKRALLGTRADGLRLYVLVLPLYLDFVQVLACAVVAGRFDWVRHDPIVLSQSAPEHHHSLEGVRLEQAPIKALLDELAVAVLSHERQGLELPEALQVLVDLLGELGP